MNCDEGENMSDTQPFRAPVFKACYSDFRIIKSRKTAQIILEVSLESANAALDTLGGVPRPDAEVWVAVALLDLKTPAEPERPAVEGQKFSSLPLVRQAGIRCADPEFQKFIVERQGLSRTWAVTGGEETAVDIVRDICGVASRSELSEANGGRAWRQLEAEFQEWRHTISFENVARR